MAQDGVAEIIDPITFEVIKHRLWQINDEPILIGELLIEFLDESGFVLDHDIQYNFWIPAKDTYNARGNSLIETLNAGSVASINASLRPG